MFSFLRSTNVVQQASRSWRLFIDQTFCCARPDALLSPKKNLSYATFRSNEEDEASEVLSSYGDHDDEIITAEIKRPTSIKRLVSRSDEPASNHSTSNVVVSQPASPLSLTAALRKSPTSPLLSPQATLSCTPAATFSSSPNKDNSSPTSEYSSSGVSSGIRTQPSSMEFSDTLDIEQSNDSDKIQKEETVSFFQCETKGDIDSFESLCEEPQIEENITHLAETRAGFESFTKPELNEVSEPTVPGTSTSEELLQVVDRCSGPMDVLDAVSRHQVAITPLLGVAIIHYIYTKALAHHKRNSPAYNELCGNILTDPVFRDMLTVIEKNARFMNNFALLTVASDLLYLRITLKKLTIHNLLSCVDYETLNLTELRLLASCLHTPNIPMLNTEYVLNVAGSVAMRSLDQINDLYTLLTIIKCFGRCFTVQAKREADAKVGKFINELGSTYPDGRLMASHMFDAFYRMEHAPSRPTQLEACRAINSSAVPLVPQDASAILRYFVKYGYNLEKDGLRLLEKISDVLYRHLETEPVTKLTTNIKWLSVFYYYNKPLMERYIAAVVRDLDKLDFVGLSDVIDTMAQIYYLPDDADSFFDKLHEEMMKKYPTLHRSSVKNVQRKVVLTAFHFSVFGRYPQSLIDLTLSPGQVDLNHGLAKHHFMELCESIRIERPDLLPTTLPPFNTNVSFTSPRLYAFEKDVRSVLSSVVGPRKFTHASSPVRGLPMFILRQQLDGSILSIKHNTPGFIPPHFRQTVHNVAIIPLPRSRFCIDSKHAVGKTRHALRLIRAQGARVITVPHFDWDGHSFQHKSALLSRKIFEQRTDDVME